MNSPHPLADRFWKFTAKRGPDECWLWLGGKDRHGYGRVNCGDKTTGAHRLSLEIATGNRPNGCVCHRCDNPSCVNPAHLWVGSHADNMRDAFEKGRSGQRRKTHCKHGHEFTPENIYLYRAKRHCRACGRARAAARAQSKSQESRA